MLWLFFGNAQCKYTNDAITVASGLVAPPTLTVTNIIGNVFIVAVIATLSDRAIGLTATCRITGPVVQNNLGRSTRFSCTSTLSDGEGNGTVHIRCFNGQQRHLHAAVTSGIAENLDGRIGDGITRM